MMMYEQIITDSYPEPAVEKLDAINPRHYKGFSNGAQVIDITENLNGNGAQAVHMIARSTRADGTLKSDPIEDLNKAAWFIARELWRRDPDTYPNPAS